MYKVATMSIGAAAFVEVAETRFCFVGSIRNSITPKLMRAVGELAALPVRTRPKEQIVFA